MLIFFGLVLHFLPPTLQTDISQCSSPTFPSMEPLVCGHHRFSWSGQSVQDTIISGKWLLFPATEKCTYNVTHLEVQPTTRTSGWIDHFCNLDSALDCNSFQAIGVHHVQKVWVSTTLRVHQSHSICDTITSHLGHMLIVNHECVKITVLCCAPQVPIGTGWFQAVPTGSDQIPTGTSWNLVRTGWTNRFRSVPSGIIILLSKWSQTKSNM